MAILNNMSSKGMNKSVQGDYMTDPRLALAMELQKTGSSTAPVQTSLEGLARALQGVVGGYQQSQLKDEYQQKGDGLTSALAQAMGSPKASMGIPEFKDPGAVDNAEMGTTARAGWQTLVPAIEPGMASVAALLKSNPEYGNNKYIQDAAQNADMSALESKTKLQDKIRETQTLFPYELAKAEAMGGIRAQQPPSGYRNTGDGSLAPIPGGPADPAAKPVKPMPATALKMQNEDLDAIGTVNGINSDLAAFSKQIDEGKLDLGLFSNMTNAARNATGMSSENSRNYASFRNTLEKLRNDSLRLNKGVQTDGDAQRAWNELMTNINDNDLVKQRIEEITKINERAADLKKLNIDNVRANYGAEPMDFTKYEKRPSAIGGVDETDPRIKAAKEAGYTDEEIQQFLKGGQ